MQPGNTRALCLWVPSGLSAFVADGFMSISAFLKRTLNILIVFVSVVYPFLKNLSHCTVIFRNNIAFCLSLEDVNRCSGRQLVARILYSSPRTISLLSKKKKKRATEAESGFQCSEVTLSRLLNIPEETGINTSPGCCCVRAKSNNTHIWKDLSQDPS